MTFLPISKKDMISRGWEELDFLLISGDAYVDHPSFGHAVISRVLENAGYRVGLVCQPDRTDVEAVKVMGRPTIGVLITAGVVDSMVNNYSAGKHKRKEDIYSPGNKVGLRPDRALIAYTSLVKQAYKGITVIIGGVEASLRRFAHYDYWSDKVRKSVLFDSKADFLIHGPGERTIVEVAEILKAGGYPYNVPGTAYISKQEPENCLEVPSFNKVVEDKKIYAEAFAFQYKEQDTFSSNVLCQQHGDRFLVSNPPQKPLTMEEMDKIYSLPYEREYHPIYTSLGGVKAIEEVKFSVISHRGCPGGCSFCSIVFNQGRIIQKRSKESILNEIRMLAKKPDFKGYITDIGGPTANFREAYCKTRNGKGVCRDRQCLYPEICENLNVDHREYIDILKEAGKIKGVKKVFIKSGVRYDYLLADKNGMFLEELCQNHISGQLKVAPEHASRKVLRYMGKDDISVYKQFTERFFEINRRLGKKQYLIPYLITGHPGETMEDVLELVEFLMDSGFVPDQIQDFYPTPGTVSTCMYYSGYDPRTMNKVITVKDSDERRKRRVLVQFSKKGNKKAAAAILRKLGRNDLAKRIYRGN